MHAHPNLLSKHRLQEHARYIYASSSKSVFSIADCLRLARSKSAAGLTTCSKSINPNDPPIVPIIEKDTTEGDVKLAIKSRAIHLEMLILAAWNQLFLIIGDDTTRRAAIPSTTTDMASRNEIDDILRGITALESFAIPLITARGWNGRDKGRDCFGSQSARNQSG